MSAIAKLAQRLVFGLFGRFRRGGRIVALRIVALWSVVLRCGARGQQTAANERKNRNAERHVCFSLNLPWLQDWCEAPLLELRCRVHRMEVVGTTTASVAAAAGLTGSL